MGRAIDSVVVSDTGKASVVKDPEAVLDYAFDWTQWLGEVSDTIVAATATVVPGDASSNVTVDSVSFTDTKVIAWVSGGTDSDTVELICHITTAAGREDERTMYLKMKER